MDLRHFQAVALPSANYLGKLLHQHSDIGLELSTPNTYCFDSESFRYLAAFKKEITMSNKIDFDRSWRQSRDESIRLISHFKTTSPHKVKNTLTLNGNCQLIAELTEPMAEISQIIQANTAMTEDKMQELKDTRLRGDQLRTRLHVQQMLKTHRNDVTLRETALTQYEQRIAEYKREREMIRDAVAKFGVFLRKYSLAPYNDALIAYLDYLIKEEQVKVQAGGNDKRLRSLTEERHKHTEAIEVIMRTMNSKASWDNLRREAIDRLVEQLYNLKHFGTTLKNMKQGIATAHQATYREMPYTVRRKPLLRKNPPNNPPRGSVPHVPEKQKSGISSLFRKVGF